MKRRGVVAIAVAVAACSSSEPPAPSDPVRPPPPLVPKVTLVGPILDPDGSKFIRDGASSGALGGKIVYTFGDTLFLSPAVDGATSRSNTAAWAELATPTVVHEPLDANGLPAQLVPFTAQEKAYNDSTKKGDDRWVIWPGRIIARSGGASGILFFDLFRIHPDHWEAVGTGVAELAAGATVATRNPTLLFQAPEVGFIHAAFDKDGFVFLYGCAVGLCRLAKAPLEGATNRASYVFWNGSGFSPSYSDAVASIPGSTAGFSVAWNPWLGQYVSFASSGIGKEVVMRVAPEPWGPWSDPTTVTTFTKGNVYAAGQHPALDADGGRTIRISAYQDFGNFQGEIDLLTLELAKR